MPATSARVLVVDDSDVARQVLSRTLERAGFAVTAASSASEASARVAAAGQERFDAVLMDLHLPDGSGIDACAAIKRRAGWEDVPVLVVTSSEADDDLTRAFACGATDYLMKPPREVELLARIRSALRLKQEMARRQARERELEALTARLHAQAGELTAAREALLTLNGELERRVRAQVDEITRRAGEVEALNAELRAQVRERSRELARALQRLGGGSHARGAGPGDVLGGRVRLVRPLATGGMGVIYAGIDLVSGSKVAIKLLDLRVHVRERDLQRFIAEASAAAAIAHPAIVGMKHLDVSDDGQPFIVMELVDGVSLDRWLARWAMVLGSCLSVAHVAADAVAAAHLAGIIHRDIKPANLMICREPPGVRVLDFGISKWRTARDGLTLTRTTGLLGTPAYMAPEQIEDAASVTPASDVYSLGTVLFEMVAGERPFGTGDLRSRIRHAFDPPPRLARRAPPVPERLDELVAACLDRDPARRPSARELADGLCDLALRLDAPPPESLLRAGTVQEEPASAGIDP